MTNHPTDLGYCSRCGAAMQLAEKFGKPRPVCPACGFVRFEDPKVTAVAFITEAGRVLLVQRAFDPEKGKWALPGGYVDRGEDPARAAEREAHEETGLIVRVTHLIDVIFDGLIVILYAAEPTGGVLRHGDDAIDARWFTPDQLPELAFRSTYMLLRDWVASQRGSPDE